MDKVFLNVMTIFIADADTLKMPGMPIVSPDLVARYPIIPIRIFTPAREKIYIDRILYVDRRAASKAGGIGDRYICLATLGEHQETITIYLDDTKWFSEEEFFICYN